MNNNFLHISNENQREFINLRYLKFYILRRRENNTLYRVFLH